ncbi:MAG: hydrogenase maturation nickel metallochaperone HypA [Nitrospirae bacterium]|nr:hydrogenase maturation nickel metallochaperone HypA [Nitrospirota bacterium]
MHELSIARGIVEAVRQHLPSGEVRSVKSVTLKLGDFTRIVPESLAFCFEMATEGTAAQGAKLKIETVPVRCLCTACGAGFEAGRYVVLCPNCGNAGVELISGNELDVVEVELSESSG